jgi:cellulose biosynthesis protein BcsQ
MSRPYVVVISSEKGGVGKTTLATNLAIYLKAVQEDLPVTLCSFDNHFSVDRMFRIRGSRSRGDIRSLFRGVTPEELVETGEFGVQFIPSHGELALIRDELTGNDSLARGLTGSQLGGILIIDTRPDLDIFTRNALFAADRVIVPIKDAPSMENCKHLYDFFDRQELSRAPLRILPCLIDSRIHFDGPFRDPYQLLKAYAINRGYRCMEGFIAKSPKVESLNTNPEGKIYPILTHGRGTEVHLQMSNIARQVLLGLLAKDRRRLDDIAEALQETQIKRAETFRERSATLRPDCLICGQQLISDQGIKPAGFYAESTSGSVRAFIDESCFNELVFRNFYSQSGPVRADDPMIDLFRESAQHTYFSLRRAPHTKNFYQQQIAFYRFDEEGLEISRKIFELKEFDKGLFNRERSRLYELVTSTLCTDGQRLGSDALVIRKVSSDFPDEILYEEAYRHFNDIIKRIAGQFVENE